MSMEWDRIKSNRMEWDGIGLNEMKCIVKKENGTE
jgi:hypothetical protein